MQSSSNAFVQIHPSMALTYGIRQGEQVRLTTRRGSSPAHRASGTTTIRMDTLFVPFPFQRKRASQLVDQSRTRPRFPHARI